jgi:hypothetical protein
LCGRGGPQAGSSWLVNFRSTSRPEASLAAIVAILGKEDCDEIERPRPRSAERGIYGQLNGKYAVRWRPQAYAITVSRFGGASRTASNPPHTPLLRAR